MPGAFSRFRPNLSARTRLLACDTPPMDGAAMARAVPADFTEFMQARWSALFRTAYLLTGNRHDAEELLQEAMARTCVSWLRIRDKGTSCRRRRVAVTRRSSTTTARSSTSGRRT